MQTTDGSERTWIKPAVVLASVVLSSLVGLVLLGSQVSGVLSTVGSSVGRYEGGAQPDNDGEPADGDSDTDSPTEREPGFVAAVPRTDLLIIKTGNLTMQVELLDKAIVSATTAIDALGGYTSGSQRSGSGQDARAAVTFRVPAARWDIAMNAIRGLASEILAEQSTTDDVTGQVVDLGARIRNLQVTEAALQSIMDRATVIKDVLAVQEELTTVRGQIEQRTAEKAHLEEQAAYSTIVVTFALKPAPVLVEQQDQFDPATEVDAASASLVGVLQDVATAGIWFGIVWLPILVTLGVIAAVAWWVVRRARRPVPEPSVGN
jgi:hypothetical protein